MSFFVTRYFNSTNQFYPWCNNLSYYPFFVGENEDGSYYCYYSQLHGKYVMSLDTVTPYSLYDSENDVNWSLQWGVYPCFSGRLNRVTMYIYKLNNTYYCSNRLYTQPLTYNKYVYENGNLVNKSVESDYYESDSSSFTNGMTFNGHGAYQGMSFTVRLKLTSFEFYVNNNSNRTNPWGVYTAYNDAAITKGDRYLGNKYWTWDNKQFILSPNKRYSKGWKSGDRSYQISNIQYIYNSIDEKHRWVIWGDDTKTWGYENNQNYPILSKDYVYTPFGKDGLTNITLVFSGYKQGNYKGLMYSIDFARAY